MKKLFLLFTILSILLIASCGKKEFNYKYLTSPKEKEAITYILVNGTSSKEDNITYLKMIKRVKDAISYNEAAARDYMEWQEEFYKKAGYSFLLDDFLDNYDGDPKNLDKFLKE